MIFMLILIFIRKVKLHSCLTTERLMLKDLAWTNQLRVFQTLIITYQLNITKPKEQLSNKLNCCKNLKPRMYTSAANLYSHEFIIAKNFESSKFSNDAVNPVIVKLKFASETTVVLNKHQVRLYKTNNGLTIIFTCTYLSLVMLQKSLCSSPVH